MNNKQNELESFLAGTFLEVPAYVIMEKHICLLNLNRGEPYVVFIISDDNKTITVGASKWHNIGISNIDEKMGMFGFKQTKNNVYTIDIEEDIDFPDIRDCVKEFVLDKTKRLYTTEIAKNQYDKHSLGCIEAFDVYLFTEEQLKDHDTAVFMSTIYYTSKNMLMFIINDTAEVKTIRNFFVGISAPMVLSFAEMVGFELAPKRPLGGFLFNPGIVDTCDFESVRARMARIMDSLNTYTHEAGGL